MFGADARTVGLLALVACVVVAGCMGGGDAGARPGEAPSRGAPADAPAATGTPAAGAATPAATEAPESRSSADGDEGTARAQPALIRTGTVALRVDDHDAARRALAERARELGGYVSDSSQTRHREGNRTWKTGYVVLRVPAGKFATMLAAARQEGAVLEERTEAKDVSDRLVDINARLENLRAKRARLRDFYARANSTEELLRIEERLSEVQGRIERLEAKKRALNDRVAFATLRVELREPSPAPTPTPTPTPAPEYHETPLWAAFTASVSQLVALGRAALVTLAYALPYLLVVGTPTAVAGGLAWWRVRG